MSAMSVILYEMVHSPYCIPIAQALRAAGVDFEKREIPNWDRSELLTLTEGEYYAVPVLVHGGRAIFESGADTLDVARYVDTMWCNTRLFPTEIEAAHLCTVDFLENTVEGVSFRLADIHYIPAIADVAARGMVIRHKERKFGRGCVDAWRRDAVAIRAGVDRLLARFETTLQSRRFLFGDAPVYADFALFGILGNFLHNEWNTLSPEQSALARFRERLAAWRW